MGLPDQGNESWNRERSTAARLAALNGRATSQGTGQFRPISTSQRTGQFRPISTSTTGEHRPLPQRPPNMPHVNENPEKRRVPRPGHQPQQPRRLRPRIIILGAIAAIIAIFVFVIFSLLLGAIGQSAGSATTAGHFLSSLASKSYNDAYQDLGPGVTIKLNPGDFAKQAGALDSQYGAITDYPEANSSATENNGIEGYTYTITRAQSGKSYNLTILLQQDPNDSNSWKIVDYGIQSKCDQTHCTVTTLGPI